MIRHFWWRLRFVIYALRRKMDLRTAIYLSGCTEDWRDVLPYEIVDEEIALSWTEG